MKKFRTVLVFILIALLATVFVACGEKEESKDVVFTVTFDSQGGSDVPSVAVKEGEKITLPSNPTKAGYVFDGWYLSTDFAKKFNARQAITADITVYAKWKEDSGHQEKETFTVKFDTRGGSEIKPIDVSEGDTIALPENPEKEGIRFCRLVFEHRI